MRNPKKVQNCSNALLSRLIPGFRPAIGLVLGTGLGELSGAVERAVRVPYSELPDFPLSTVDSHQGLFTAGWVGGVPVLLQEGRCHLYEGYSPEEVVTGVRVMASLGVRVLALTNASGALNPIFEPGEVMLITDHINFTGQSPLTGPNDDHLGPRFPDMSSAYDPRLIELARQEGLRQGIILEKGVYLGLRGPQLETPAETRMFRQWGADAVGMSSVMETIAARHLGLRVLGLSCLSNKNLPDAMQPNPLEEIIRVAALAGQKLQRLLPPLLEQIHRDFTD